MTVKFIKKLNEIILVAGLTGLHSCGILTVLPFSGHPCLKFGLSTLQSTNCLPICDLGKKICC